MKKAMLLAGLACLMTFGAAGTLLAEAEKPAVSGAEVGKWTMDAPAAMALAKQMGKPVFLCFTGSDWCGWCKLMEKQVFSAEAWQAYAKDNLVLVWVDFPRDKTLVPEALKPQNEALGKQYQVQGYPTYVVLSPEGKELGRLGAGRNVTPEAFIRQLKAVLVLNRLQSLLSAEDWAQYQKLAADKTALDAEGEAWQKKVQAEMTALREKAAALDGQIAALKDKAVKAAEQAK